MSNPRAPELTGDWLTQPETTIAEIAPAVGVVLFATPGEPSSTAMVDLLAEMVADAAGDLSVVVSASPRLASEADLGMTQDWVALLGHSHIAVVHDPVLANWARYNPRGWPTAMVIDRRGRVPGAVEGFDPDGLAVLLAKAAAQTADADAAVEAKAPTYQLPNPRRQPRSELRFPSGVAVADDGTIVVANTGGDEVWWLRLESEDTDAGAEAQTRSTVRAQLVATVSDIDRPTTVVLRPPGDDATTAATVVVTEPSLGRLIEIGPDGAVPLVSGLGRPTGLAVADDGTLIIADGARGDIWSFDNDELTPITTHGHALSGPTAVIALRPSDRQTGPAPLVVAEASTSRIAIVRRGRVRVASGAPDRPGLLDGRAWGAAWQRPSGFCGWGDKLVAVDAGSNAVRTLHNGTVETLPVSGLCRPEAVAALDAERLLIADTGNHRLVLVEPAKGLVRTLDIVEQPVASSPAVAPTRRRTPVRPSNPLVPRPAPERTSRTQRR